MPENTPIYQDRVLLLRKEILKEDIDGYIIPRTDEFQGEFIAPYAQRLAWISGFTGSAGNIVILPEKAVIMSDGRYTLQLREEVDTTLFDLEDSTKTTIGEWLAAHAPEKSRIGYDVWLHTPLQIEEINKHCKEKSITLVPCSRNLIDALWFDQPARPSAKLSLFPDEIAGKTASEKCDGIAAKLREKGAAACLISALDSICWLLNIRGADIEYSPLCLSYVLLHDDGSVDWFIDPAKLTRDITEKLGVRLRIYGFDALRGRFKQLHTILSSSDEKRKESKIVLCLDRSATPIWFEQVVKEAGIDVSDVPDPCVLPKAVKTKSEREAIHNAHIQDGVALTRFLKWVDENQNTSMEQEMDEMSVERVLEQFRKTGSTYVGPSFPTIAGFAGNGAIIHYRANEKTCRKIKGDGLLLVDSGGQYRWGTTDITRTMAIGTPSREMQENYTRVLKGHITVASAVFPKDTTGAQIDALARKSLQEAGLDYAHGTGHGVGCYLCVHEQSTQISQREKKTFSSGMLVSNEPGYYKEGEYGIRIENLVLVRECHDPEKQGYYCFETVSYAPLDPKLIITDMLNEAEKNWLGIYLGSVKTHLFAYLNNEERAWLDSCLALSSDSVTALLK
ncbi:MAG: aminopeptidase P family protein [Alphaproteobacteria bacterium]|nr:aminopeptidase P family protein [Alphaproteobacteria bacterium]